MKKQPRRPIIGLTTYGREELRVDYKYYDQFYAIPTEYVDAVRRAGGVPILLPPGESDWSEILEAVDGVIVIGGGDVDPAEYAGDAAHLSLGGIDRERDASEIRLVRELLNGCSQPTLCICRGMQLLNVAQGGTLLEHIPDTLPEDIHRAEGGGWTVQTVNVDPHSRLAEVMEAAEVATYSGHHQAVRKVAEGLTVVAHAPDGIIEALEAGQHPWLVAVQWHPEMSAADDPTQQRIFDRLVEAARG